MNRNRLISIFAIFFILVGVVVAFFSGGIGGNNNTPSNDDKTDSNTGNDTAIVDTDNGKNDNDDSDKINNDNLVEYEKNDIYYERDPEYVKRLEDTYGKESISYIDGRSYCLVDTDGEGKYDSTKSVCPEGDERLTNTLKRSDYQFIRDAFCTIDKASMSTDKYDDSEVEIIIGNKELAWEYVYIYVDIYDKDGVVIYQTNDMISNVQKNTKYRLTAIYYCGEDDPKAESFRIRSMKFSSDDGSYLWVFEDER